MSRCTLEFGADLVVVASGGTLDAEYVLFDPGDIELSATGPGTIREVGYRTTIGEARARLTHAGITRELSDRAVSTARPWVAETYARTAAVRRIADRLEASELFDGRVFDPASGQYEGAWLDMPALVSALLPRLPPALAGACGRSFQALHLAALLDEHADDEAVALTTTELTALRRPGERTYKRLTFPEPSALVEALGALKVGRERGGPEIGPGRKDVMQWLRERAQRVPSAAGRFSAMEEVLGARDPPARGPLADADLWALESKLSMGETEGVAERLEAIEQRRGRLPGTTYLRARVALMAGTEQPRAIAERAAALSSSMGGFDELQLLAAQAWAAAGDVRRAHAFARDLSESATASDAIRMHAREVLDATGRATTAPEGGVPIIPKAPLAPSGTDLDISLGDSTPPSSRSGSRDTSGSAKEANPPSSPDLSLPSYRIEPSSGFPPRLARPSAAPADAELVETLSLPAGLQEEPPPHDELPSTPQEARLTCIYLARELGRDLRIRHGCELKLDVAGLELAQRCLHEAVAGERAEDAQEEREIMRHAAFLSELLARRLAGRWVDLESPDPGRWAMLVPSVTRVSDVSRTWPVGRILRFLAQRHRERDLVSYYLELEAFAR